MCVNASLTSDVQSEVFALLNTDPVVKLMPSCVRKEVDDILAVCISALNDKKGECRQQAETFLKN